MDRSFKHRVLLQLQHEPVRRCLMHLKNSSHWLCTRSDPPLDPNTMSSSFKFGCASCHFLRGCKEEINSNPLLPKKPHLMFCSTPNDLCGWRLKEAPLELKEEHHL
ncbi:hypothetical protein TNCV_1390721 [Trichonephila clavipes]|nr:hypothetical protein TNCV_1390721 [Trichonephila clavipes]